MVALKPAWLSAEASSSRTKQERRGGIETDPLSRGPPHATGKQERRGGIETELLEGAPQVLPQEAGTPWWH